MNQNENKEKQGLIIFLSFLIFSVTAALLILIYRGNITVMAESRVERGYFNRGGENEMISELITDRSGYLRIPLPDTVEENDIVVTEDPYKKLIYVKINGADEEFYKDNFFSGNMTGISDVKYGCLDGVSTIELGTDKIRVPVTEYMRGSFYIRVASPAEVYDRVVVIDPGHGGDDTGSVVYGIEEKEITLKVARKLKKRLDSIGAKAYLLSRENAVLSAEDIAETANNVDADIIITLHTGADANTRITKGVEAKAANNIKTAAGKLTAMLSEACDQKDLGVSDEEVPEIAELTASPYIWLKLGVITNKEEAVKMSGEDYQNKAADTIAEFIETKLERSGK